MTDLFGLHMENEDIPDQFPEDLTPIEDLTPQEETSQDHGIEELVSMASYVDTLNEFPTDMGLISLGKCRGYLLSSTSELSLEAAGTDAAVAATTDVAESARASFAEKLMGWTEKLRPTINATVKKVTDFVTKHFDTLTKFLSTHGATLAKTARTYSFVIVFGAVTACAGLSGVLPAILRYIPTIAASIGTAGGSAATLVKGAARSLGGIVRNIKWPFGSLDIVTKGETGLAFVVKNKKTLPITAGTPQALGWSKRAMQAVMDKLKDVQTLAPGLSDLAVKQYQSEVTSISTLVKNKKYVRLIGSAALKLSAYLSFIKLGWEIVKAMFALLKEVVWGTFRLVSHAFNAVLGRRNVEGPANA